MSPTDRALSRRGRLDVRRARPRPRLAALALIGATSSLTLTVLAPVGAATMKSTKTVKHSGNVDVYYAASLQTIFENTIGPAFTKATGYTFTGFSGASGTLANEIKGGIVQGDVFVSAAESTNLTLEGASNGSWVSSFLVWGQSPLVIGYNSKSSFASLFKKLPWYSVLLHPGIRVGRTDPATDPKGKLTVQAVTAAEQIYNNSALGSITGSSANIYPEQTLVGLLQAGQLDAGFFYSSEAKAAGIPTVSLGRRVPLAATYTLALLKGAPNTPAAIAFADFLLGPIGRNLLHKNGVNTLRPRIVGSKSSLPKSLRQVISEA